MAFARVDGRRPCPRTRAGTGRHDPGRYGHDHDRHDAPRPAFDVLDGLVHCGASTSAADDAPACGALLVPAPDGTPDWHCPHQHLQVDHDVLEQEMAAIALSRLASPNIRPKLERLGSTNASPEGLAAWWADAPAPTRRELLTLLLTHVVVCQSTDDLLETEVEWRES